MHTAKPITLSLLHTPQYYGKMTNKTMKAACKHLHLVQSLTNNNLPATKEEVYVFVRVPLSVCLSVCVWATLLKNACMDLDARTGLLSPISYMLQCGILLHRENPTYSYWYTYRSLQWRVVLNAFIHCKPWEQLCQRHMHSTKCRSSLP